MGIDLFAGAALLLGPGIGFQVIDTPAVSATSGLVEQVRQADHGVAVHRCADIDLVGVMNLQHTFAEKRIPELKGSRALLRKL